ncbi:ATP-dependent DNA helicase [Streptococcus sobrinus]|uniref:ATP-dependent DNA helicase n=1 Tax=Streptococcus sobrinus TaxID=1310 RepID=UPI000D706A42|nr:ATP-dependent RecD-like DNA helicase [Streptococcus sobrinus]AWN61770.1 helicase [Streptococcus sobrinus]AWN63641.1 helicase [Streptococcus sobrinus]SQG20303.1 exodeoxyribonuclease V alpha chain [Streptococcus sobrinus]
MKIDKHILDINNNICKNIELLSKNNERGFFSQNILNELRNFVEHIAIKVYNHDNHEDLDFDYDNIEEGLRYIKNKGKYRFLNDFHRFLLPTASHYTLDENNSERLMLKYYEYLLKIKKFLKVSYNFYTLDNLGKFPLFMDTISLDYYTEIADAIDNPRYPISFNERYYIQKIKPFFVNQNIYYEVTYTPTDSTLNKFDRITAYTNKEILSNYATKLYLRRETIDIYGASLPILIIDDWEVSIRECEFNKLKDILKINSNDIRNSHAEYRILMSFLKHYHMNLVDIVALEDEVFDKVKKYINQKSQVSYIFDLFEVVRSITKYNQSGSNVLKYLLFHMNNKILKDQYYYDRHPSNKLDGGNRKLSGLRLSWKCIPFDTMPFCTSLIKHNPRIYDLLECIDSTNREHELLARLIKNNTEVSGILYTSLADLPENFRVNINDLVDKYNSKIIAKHGGRKLVIKKGQIFISQYEKNIIEVLSKLSEFSGRNNVNHRESVEYWISQNPKIIDDDYKKEKLKNLFSNSAVAIVYGAAGTGKTYFINHIAQLFNSSDKLFLAVTHTAVENLKRRIKASNCEFSTVASIKNHQKKCDILLIDECSTVSNEDMRSLLENISCKFLVLVGDKFQIEAIKFGNWFEIAGSFIKPEAIVELETPYRTTDKNLINVWKKVREIEPDILEYLTRNNYTHSLDDSIFNKRYQDEIILSLNYDGIYGINNINRLLQAANPNKAVEWNSKLYKVGDPVVFNENARFSDVLYNNLKGVIRKIDVRADGIITFEIELLDTVLNGLDIVDLDLELVNGYEDTTNSVVRFNVNEYKSTDEDENDSRSIVPFQTSYAISIHKAQGLEYESVKIVMTNEVDEQINHNIFYTAITRTKQHLTIYWSPETEKQILSNLSRKNIGKDIGLLKYKFSNQNQETK